MTVPALDKVIHAFMLLRSQKDAIEAKAKAEVTELKAKMAQLEAHILAQMDAQGVDSYKTKFGTAFKTQKDYANVAAWDDLLSFIKLNEAWHLLEKRVNKTAVKGYLEDGRDIPPGVDYGTIIDISVRKPTGKN